MAAHVAAMIGFRTALAAPHIHPERPELGQGAPSKMHGQLLIHALCWWAAARGQKTVAKPKGYLFRG